MSFAIEIAGPEDDAAIRRLLARGTMPGRVRVTYEREPGFFDGCATIGRDCQVLVAREETTGEIGAVACRSWRMLYVNGRPERVGYLGQLRVDERFRGRWLVSKGFRFLRELDVPEDEGSITTMTNENRESVGILVQRPRPRFPTFREVAQLHTLALAVSRPRRPRRSRVEVGRAGAGALPDVVAFLNEHGRGRQFFPVWEEADFGGDATLGFDPGDFLVALRSGTIAGVLGLWDQSSFKQVVVRGYEGLLGRARPAYNIWARATGRGPLPAVGERLRHAYASFVCVEGGDRDVADALLDAVLELAHERRIAYVMLGLGAEDPLLSAARTRPHVRYDSRLYTIDWEGGSFHERLDGRVPHVEIALL